MSLDGRRSKGAKLSLSLTLLLSLFVIFASPASAQGGKNKVEMNAPAGYDARTLNANLAVAFDKLLPNRLESYNLEQIFAAANNAANTALDETRTATANQNKNKLPKIKVKCTLRLIFPPPKLVLECGPSI